MKFQTGELEQQSVAELQMTFSRIPKNINCITLQGTFSGNLAPARALYYLPKHVAAIIFEVNCVVSLKLYNKVVSINGPFGEQVVSTNHLYKIKSIGRNLKNYIASLPTAVKIVRFYFMEADIIYDKSIVLSDLKLILQKLPPTVTRLYFHTGREFLFQNAFPDSIAEVFNNIPPTIKIFSPGRLNLTSLPLRQVRLVIASIPRDISHLSLANNFLGLLRIEDIPDVVQNFPHSLFYLDLGYNQFHHAQHLTLLLSSLHSIKGLGLAGNKLAQILPEELSQILSACPAQLEHLDLGENGLLLLPVDQFIQVISSLAKTISSLRICENRQAIRKEDFIKRLLYIPAHVRAVSFWNSNLLGLSNKDFLEVVNYLPPTVEELDLSSNRFENKTASELAYLLSNLPLFIKKIKITNNHLGGFTLDELQIIFGSLSSSILKIDISATGLDRLPYHQVQQIFSFFPDTVKVLACDSASFYLRKDGSLIPRPIGFLQTEICKSQRFYHQSTFASLRLIMMQLSHEPLNFDVVLRIFAFVSNASEKEVERLRKPLSTLLISSSPPQEITLDDENICLWAVSQRIKNIERREHCLDLSRCGLNRLVSNTSQRKFINLLKTLHLPIKNLNLRGNGFSTGANSLKVFIKLIPHISSCFNMIDLSENGFEQKNAEELSQLFLYLPNTITKVSLGDEKALSPALQIAKRHWPATYDTLVKNSSNKFEQGRALLQDYSKGSKLSRFLLGHWNLHHVKEVERLLYFINNGLITEFSDLEQELKEIQYVNSVGSLAKRLSFLSYRGPIGELTLESPLQNAPM